MDRRGEPQAVILGVEDYLWNFVEPSAVLTSIHREAKAKRLNQLSLRAINVEIRRSRQARRRGRP